MKLWHDVHKNNILPFNRNASNFMQRVNTITSMYIIYGYYVLSKTGKEALGKQEK